MIYLLLSISCSLIIAATLKFSQGKINNPLAMFMTNYIICIACGFYFSGIPVISKESSLSWYLGIISGFLYITSFLVTNYDVSKNGVVMQSVFSKLGVVVTTIISFVFFKQILVGKQILGIVLALIAIVLIYFEKNSTTLITSKSLLIINLLTSGISESVVSIYDYYGNPLFKDQFLLIIFVYAFIFTIIFMLIKRKPITKYEILFGVLIGVPNYFSARFTMYALNYVPSIIVYPILSIGGIATITLMGYFIFKEKLTLKKWIGIGIIGIAILFLS